jgi:hypothetical protein
MIWALCDDVQLCNCCVRELLILARTWFAFDLPSKTGCDIIPHNLLSDEHVWAHSCCLTPPTCQEQVPQDEEHGGCCDEFVSGLDRRLPVNFGLLDRVSLWCIIYFVQNPYYIVKRWHSFLYNYSLYVWDLVPAHLVFISRPSFGPLKPECDRE